MFIESKRRFARNLGKMSGRKNKKQSKNVVPEAPGFELIARIWGQKSPVVVKPIGEKIGTVCMHSSW